MIRLILSILIAALLPLSAHSYETKEKPLIDVGGEVAICQSAAVKPSNSAQATIGSEVIQYFSSLFNTDSWPSRWSCGDWSQFHGWFYIGSDFLIWMSYFTIPCILFFFLYKRKENLPFRGVFVFFIGFILLCGLTHLIDVLIFWWPAYRLSALIRFGTALVSMGTIFALVKVIPRALELRGPGELEKIVKERTREISKLNSKYEQELLERKNAENEIKRLNKELTYFRQAISDSSIISMTDKKGTINYVNDNFVKISGYQEEELLGENHRIINSSHHPREFWINMWRTISRGKTWREEVKNRAKDGSYYWVDTFIMPFKDVKGRVNQYLSIRNDITERKSAEEELKELNNTLEIRVEEKTKHINSYNEQLKKINELFESVQAHAHIGVWEYDLENEKLYLSKEAFQILKYPSNKEVLFNDILKFVHNTFKRKLVEAISLCRKEGKKYDFELLIKTYEKREIWVRTTGIPDYQEDKIVKIKGMIQNIDSLKRNEIELRESKAHLTEINEELESFTYTVSHDLRAPLRYIHGHAKILEEDYTDKLDDEGNEILQVIMNNTEKLGQLIDDLLDFARLGRAEMVYDKCDMSQIIHNIIQDHFLSEIRDNTNLNIKKLYPARGDYNMIWHVWMNLISNAIKYSSKKDDTYIEIGSETMDNEICYYVKDRGVGFDPQYTHKLFGVFQRLHRVEEFEGTGVGLAIVHRIISRHNGKVWATAQKNKGATFYFTLPK